MQFDSFNAFLAMGGYGFYVWLAYGVTALLLVILIINSKSQNKAVIKHIIARQKRENKLRQAAAQQQQAKASADLNTAADNDSKEVLS